MNGIIIRILNYIIGHPHIVVKRKGRFSPVLYEFSRDIGAQLAHIMMAVSLLIHR